MFPDDAEHEEIPEDDECPNCGGLHGDLMGPFSEWLVDTTNGHASLGQLLSIYRSIILNMRMNFSTEVINALFAAEVVRVEEILRETNYSVKNNETGDWQKLPTYEDQREIDKLAEQLGDTIPNWVLGESEEE